MTFYERYANTCLEKGIDPCSQRTADLFGVSRSTISSWNKKNTNPKGETVAVIADELGVSADYLLGRTDDPTDYSNGELIAEQNTTVLEHFDGDIKRSLDFQKAVENDVRSEQRADVQAILSKYNRLDSIDKVKAEAYFDGLLSADKYRNFQEKDA
jgi:transcriptional regulator with XRE-family HTH domain